ncbi:hypothetical protein [Kordiimonas aestuarii]|uniref:hypothetical protein n=1 Tax=Kordiimonas aestuarii TaxID=1005925 RepID=UPI0021D2C371|nr:hypothetical protein [Kordiimonas aestuarii]
MVIAKKLFLHIGLHKTGTSAIQHALFHAREKLLAQNYLYPKSVAWDDHSHHRLLLPFWQGEDYGEAFDLLADEVAAEKCSNLILSSELFPNAYQQGARFPPLWDRVCALAEEIEIILYARRQDRLAASVFKQWSKSDDLKLAMSPSDFIADEVRINMDIEHYCRGWTNAPKVSALHLRSYDAEKKNLIKSFLAILGLPADTLSGLDRVRANPTLDGQQLIFRHYFNGLDLNQETSDALLSYILGNLSSKPALDIFTPEERHSLLERYKESNEAAFGGYGNTTTPFDSRMEESGHVFRKPTTPEILDFFVNLSQFDKRLAAHLFDKVIAKGTGDKPR